jgi:hypothetical protein
MMVGNLVDLTFDGQSSIFERCIDACTNSPQTHVGADEFNPCAVDGQTRCDDPKLERYAFAKAETMAMAPWVLPDNPCPLCVGPIANREVLAARARSMQAGTGTEFENDYLETAIYADLKF